MGWELENSFLARAHPMFRADHIRYYFAGFLYDYPISHANIFPGNFIGVVQTGPAYRCAC